MRAGSDLNGSDHVNHLPLVTPQFENTTANTQAQAPRVPLGGVREDSLLPSSARSPRSSVCQIECKRWLLDNRPSTVFARLTFPVTHHPSSANKGLDLCNPTQGVLSPRLCPLICALLLYAARYRKANLSQSDQVGRQWPDRNSWLTQGSRENVGSAGT